MIPLDVTIEILKRLPAKSIMRFSCVSNQWGSIIRSRSFTDSFMSLSLTRPRLLLSYKIEGSFSSKLLFFSSPLPSQESKHSSTILPSIPDLTIYYSNTKIDLCNTVRGLFCVSKHRQGFEISNPVTRQGIRIPNDSAGCDSNYNNMCRMYLGHTPKDDQYKVLRIMMSRDGSVEHSVCTLEGGDQESTLSSWRRVTSSSTIFYYLCETNAVCINGVLYYKAWKKPWRGFLIVSFDVGAEQVRVIEAPKGVEEYRPLINYQGKLGCFCFAKPDCYTFWILDDVDEKLIWTSKTGVFPPSFRDTYKSLNLRICGSTGAGEIVFVSRLMDGVFKLFDYDLKKNSMRRRVRVGRINYGDKFTYPDDQNLSFSCDHVENIISL